MGFSYIPHISGVLEVGSETESAAFEFESRASKFSSEYDQCKRYSFHEHERNFPLMSNSCHEASYKWAHWIVEFNLSEVV